MKSMFRWLITVAGIITALTCSYVLNSMEDKTDVVNIPAAPIFSRNLEPPADLVSGVSDVVVFLYDSAVK